MKKHKELIFKKFVAVTLSLVLFVSVFAIAILGIVPNKHKNNIYQQETPEPLYSYYSWAYPEIDVMNLSGMSQWSQVPLVSQKLLDEGFAGGESCQRLVGIEMSKSDPNIMFLGTDVGGLFRSKDGGCTWSACFNGLDRRGAGQIAIDPLNSKHIVVTNTASGESSSKYFSCIYYSFDGGDSWQASAGTDLKVAGAHYYYKTIAFDEQSYNAELGYCTDIYYSTPYERDSDKQKKEQVVSPGLYKSADGGKSFEKYSDQDKLYDGMMLIENGKIFLGNQWGLFAEKDDQFEQINNLNIQSLVKAGGNYYILTNDALFVADLSLNFSEVQTSSFPADEARNLAVSQINPNNMIMSGKKSDKAYSERIFISHDGGETWVLKDLGKTDTKGMFFNFTWGISAYLFNDSVDGEIIGTTSNTVIRSRDNGETWRVSNDGIANAMVGAKFNFNIFDSDLIYMGIQDFGGALSTDGGKTWQKLSLSKDSNGKNIYGGYAVTKDTLIGVYTEQWGDGTKRTRERYVCYSFDGGETVNIRMEDLEDESKQEYLESIHISNEIATSCESSYQSPIDKNVLFCGNYRSSDGGHTWENMLDYQTPCLQVYTHFGNTLYGVSLKSDTDDGVYVLKSEDSGATWERVNGECIAGSEKHIIDMAVDGQNGYIYAVYSKKLWRMKLDGSEITNLTSRMLKDNWNSIVLNSVAVDPIHSEIVYCGGSGDFYASSRGIRRSCDSGETWQTVTTSLVQDSIVYANGESFGYETKCIRVNPKTGELWSGSSCLGFSKLTPPYESSSYQSKENSVIMFNLGYDNKIGVLTTKKDRIIYKFADPVREGYKFLGWFYDSDFTNRFVFGIKAPTSLMLYAKWQLE